MHWLVAVTDVVYYLPKELYYNYWYRESLKEQITQKWNLSYDLFTPTWGEVSTSTKSFWGFKVLQFSFFVLKKK